MKQAQFAFFLTCTLILVVSWIVFNVLHILWTSSISSVQQAEIAPINGSFDTATIMKITNRIQVVPQYSVIKINPQVQPNQAGLLLAPTLPASSSTVSAQQSSPLILSPSPSIQPATQASPLGITTPTGGVSP